MLTAGWRELPAVGELCLQVLPLKDNLLLTLNSQMRDETGARRVINQRAFLKRKKEEMTRRGAAVCRDKSEKKPLVPLIVKGDLELVLFVSSSPLADTRRCCWVSRSTTEHHYSQATRGAGP